jgi:diguanylate cyclase (GGDEF)-like protein
MQAPAAASSPSNTAQRSLVAFELLILGIGVTQFAFAPASIDRPMVAVSTLGTLASLILMLRIALPLRQRARLQHGLSIVVMCVAISLLAFATGSAKSLFTALYCLPIVAAAIAFGRWWPAMLVALLCAALWSLLGTQTAEPQVASPEFIMMLLTGLAPAAAIAFVLAILVERMQHAARKIRDLSATDALTGLLNLPAFENVLQQEHRKAERFGRTYAIVMIDIDNLAEINESLGHEAGNMILNAVAAAIGRSVRNSDVAARFGGDEFIVLCVESTPDVATAIAQRIRNIVYAGTVSVANRLVRANVSVGVANFPADHLYPKELMILAERRMQQDQDLRRKPVAL